MTTRTDSISSVRFYIDKIVSDPLIGGMKALLLDARTTKIVSMVYSQTQILEQEVYLVEQLGKSHEPMPHLKAAVFLQPTEANLLLLLEELADPKFAEYHLYFSNIVPSDMLLRLGRADEQEVIRQVQEYYADFIPVNEEFFHLGISDSSSLSLPARSLTSSLCFDQNVSGVLSLLLALKRKPAQIRHQFASETARRLAGEILTQIERDDVFEFRTPGPLLLILDRRDDPITPLLTQWTYQAMVHEMLGLDSNRVVLKDAPGVKEDMKEVVLSCTQDDFFAANRFANFGDLGSAIKDMLDQYQRDSKLNEKISSIEDMQNFMSRYPAFRSRSINVSKHVAVMSELSRLTDARQLLDISQLEQEIVCSNDHATHKRELLEKLDNPAIKSVDKIRLTALFTLRYESYNELRELKGRLAESGVSESETRKLEALINYAGENRRAPGLFGTGVSGIVSQLGKALGGIQEAQNVYTQHQPVLSAILDTILKGKLKDSSFPPITSGSVGRISEVIVFIAGGVTFEEAAKVAEFNATNPSLRVYLGGSCIHNSKSFLAEIASIFGR